MHTNYDFPTIVLCTIFQLILIYTESAALSFLTFVFYSLLVGMHLLHLARRWYYNIDGRYDVRQIIRDNEITLRIQYAVAIFSPLILGFLSWAFVELNNGLVHSLLHVAVLIQVTFAVGQLGLEFYEVCIANKKQ
ncbi:Protein CBG20338 [Caenorhabditis briggsae]|uniref:Protein CBG20338 n=1 Tax=Caenorhabditis briggsae TaxID=6238 RepID=A8XXK7_CAEBR|nr:Protein CBG20338 [Caenorhabditis briggsae]CAP37376.2 Protein CBG20338 [Caenorhabditis briggsae]